MHIFLSYPSEHRDIAESIAFSLRHDGHQVFFDKDNLPPSLTYDANIRNAIKKSDYFVFLVSPETFDQNSYTLTELKLAREKWPGPSGYVLPVLISPTPLETLPPYLKSVGILEPDGNVTAEVAQVAARIRDKRRHSSRWRMATYAAVALALMALGLGAYLKIYQKPVMAQAEIDKFYSRWSTSGDRGANDANNASWCNLSSQERVSIAGDWCGRWNRTGEGWSAGAATVKLAGDNVEIRFNDGVPYLIEAKRIGERNLKGHYVNLEDRTEATPWTGRIVSNSRIDGFWPAGRWDFRR